MRNLIKKILKESVGGNYYYLITTKDGKYYLNDGDGFDSLDELFPLDGTLDYEELDRLHNPTRGANRLFTSSEKAERVLKNLPKAYDDILNSPGWSQDEYFLRQRKALINQMKELGYTWGDLEVREYYLGLIPTNTNI